MLFHEIYGSYYQTVGAILREAVQGTLTQNRLRRLVQTHAFSESFLNIPDGLTGERWRLMHRDLSAELDSPPARPLSLLEKRWLRALLLDPRIRLFDVDMRGLEEVKPLFTPDMFVYFDRYADGDDYHDPLYIAHFRTILTALREKKDLYLCYEARQRRSALVLTPHQLEYSEKDDCFCLIASASAGNGSSACRACWIALLLKTAAPWPTIRRSPRRLALSWRISATRWSGCCCTFPIWKRRPNVWTRPTTA